MLGNDIVDLSDVDARPETFRSRFDARVFSDDERRAIADDPSPRSLRWAHWAAKEAAYKSLRQDDPRFVFSPGRLEARFETADPSARMPGATQRRGLLRVIGAAGQGESSAAPPPLSLRSFETAEWVHVVAWPSGRDESGIVEAIEPLTRASDVPLEGEAASGSRAASLAVRRLARRELARVLGVDPARITIGRRDRMPVPELDGACVPIALSLSHHGRFVACAIAPLRAAKAGDAASATKRVLMVGSMGDPARGWDAKRKTG